MKGLFKRFRAFRPAQEVATSLAPIRLGICAMDKKAKSKQMNQIIERLKAYGEFEMVYWGDDVIVNKPVEDWPKVDCLLSWHSDGFPLEKAVEYVKLRRPFLVNDLDKQFMLLDRLTVYRTLVANNIPVPLHIIVDRIGLEPGEDPPGFTETEDYVELNGVRISKPFVEKPKDAEDHNIWIYYPHAQGGGVKKLFRKVDNKSSAYDPTHCGSVRRNGSYIYEEFLATGGTDVKVYTVGPSYAHAEARKSPVVDGKVLRTADGKEMRFPVLLTPQEKEVARLVVNAFRQSVCGFDLLRSDKGVSYVCDVNGWSFVKNSKRYYDDTAGILRSILIGGVDPIRLTATPKPLPSFNAVAGPCLLPSQVHGLAEDDAALLGDQEAEDDEVMQGVSEEEVERTDNRTQAEELRCVLAVIRHGDRTPKQKLKLKVTAEPLLSLFQRHKDSKGKQAKLKTPGQLQELLDITRDLLLALDKVDEASSSESPSPAATQSSAAPAPSPPPAPAPGAPAALPDTVLAHPAVASTLAQLMAPEERAAALEFREKLRIVKTVLEQASFNGINRKVQLKPTRWGLAPHPSSITGILSGTGGASSMGALAPSDSLLQHHASGHTSNTQDAAAAPAGNASTAGGGSSGVLRSAVSFLASTLNAATPGGEGTPAPVMVPVLEEALMVVKWGGVLTHAGRQQAEDLGKVFRLVMYPRYGSAGGGLLRLHSTYRHDLKIYSSDEGRVQASAAAFAKGLLDLEGTSLTPILVSLVKKDASMLEAFGKGASDDIHNAKNILYQVMTSEPDKQPNNTAPATAAAATPPLSPFHADVPGSAASGSPQDASTGAGAAATKPGGKVDAAAAVVPSGHASPGPGSGAHGSGEGGAAAASGTAVVPGAQQQQQLTLTSSGPLAAYAVAMPSQLSRNPSIARSSGKGLIWPVVVPSGPIKGMPEHPLQLLKRLVELMKALVGQLRMLCLQERVMATKAAGEPLLGVGGGRPAGVGSRYSSVSHEPSEWVLEPDRPCSGERLLLMFDRWQKLHKSFYLEKKDTFDISKVPDIYDSAKYDAIHNSHLKLDMKELYHVSKLLADAVIPSEYGVDPQGKLCIGSTIAAELVGKLLVDLAAMREESLANPEMMTSDGQPTTTPASFSAAANTAAAAASAAVAGLANVGRPPTVPTSRLADSSGPGTAVGGGSSGLSNSGTASLVAVVKDAAREVRTVVKERAHGAVAVAHAALDKLALAVAGTDHSSNASSASTAAAVAAAGPPGMSAAGGLKEALGEEDKEPSLRPLRSMRAPGIDHGGIGAAPAADAPTKSGEGTPISPSPIPPSPSRLRNSNAPTSVRDPPVHHASVASLDASSDRPSDNTFLPIGVLTEDASAAVIGALNGSTAQHQQAQAEEKEEVGEEAGEEAQGDSGDGPCTDNEVEAETIHRLCPEYAPHINSPLRHVRTRIYFTSESHIHSLVNVLRYCHLHPSPNRSDAQARMSETGVLAMSHSSGGGNGVVAGMTMAPATANLAVAATAAAKEATSTTSPPPASTAAAAAAAAAAALIGGKSTVLSVPGCQLLDSMCELDYLTHIVLRMYENKAKPVASPERFRVEIMFSPGALFEPYEEHAKAAAAGAKPPVVLASHLTGSPPTTPEHPSSRHQHTHSNASQPAASTAAAASSCSSVPPSPSSRGCAPTASTTTSPGPPMATPPSGAGVGECQPSSVGEALQMAPAVEEKSKIGCRGPAWHVLPVQARRAIHEGESGVTLTELEDALLPMARVVKFAPPSYLAYLAQRAGTGVGGTGGAGGTTCNSMPSGSRLQSRFSSSVNIKDTLGGGSVANKGMMILLHTANGAETPVSLDSTA